VGHVSPELITFLQALSVLIIFRNAGLSGLKFDAAVKSQPNSVGFVQRWGIQLDTTIYNPYFMDLQCIYDHL
jgi:hypothetical protein